MRWLQVALSAKPDKEQWQEFESTKYGSATGTKNNTKKPRHPPKNQAQTAAGRRKNQRYAGFFEFAKMGNDFGCLSAVQSCWLKSCPMSGCYFRRGGCFGALILPALWPSWACPILLLEASPLSLMILHFQVFGSISQYWRKFPDWFLIITWKVRMDLPILFPQGKGSPLPL